MKKNWFNKNYKWLVPISFITILTIYLISSSGLGKISTDLTQAYLDDELYTKVIEKVNRDHRVEKILGEIQPIDKMTILNGEVKYSDNNQKVISTIKIKGEKANAKLDLTAHRKDEKWKYDQINIRILNRNDKNQILNIITSKEELTNL